ncbi:MAG: ATP-binding cassette domain-containing protein [Bifidobacteriaceae bacterium]|jgi:D-methionine transport system ATP-binding protein|nr:ATP-binding cassette domain-containing protein [Bifidobacteriaceae bacterium]
MPMPDAVSPVPPPARFAGGVSGVEGLAGGGSARAGRTGAGREGAGPTGAGREGPGCEGPGREPIIQFRDVTKTFRSKGRTVLAVDHVSLDIEAGEIFGFIGYSGAGKSTLVRLINALEKADSGIIRVDGREVTALGEKELCALRADIGMIFQQFNLFSARTVLANVAYPLRLAGVSKDERTTHARQLLDFVGLGDKAAAYPAQLSGGQKQRVGIARALAARPRILLADEATSALDPETTRDVLDLLIRINRDLGVTIVIITHAMSVVQHACHRVAVMEAGRVVERGTAYEIFADPTETVTRRFIQTALHDRPSPAVVERLRERHPGRLAMVTLKDRGAQSFALTAATEGTGVSASIVYGSIVEVDTRPFGSVTLALDGPATGVEAVLDRLRGAGSHVQDLGTALDPIPDPLWEALTRPEARPERGGP